MDNLAHEPEVGLHVVCRRPQRSHEVEVEHVGRIQPDSVHVEFAHPKAHHVAQVVAHGRVALVELGQKVVSAPGLVGEAVAVLVVSREIHVAVPVAIDGLLASLTQIGEGEEVASGVVEHAVEHDLHPGVVAGTDEVDKVVVGAESRVEQLVVGGLVAVSHRLEQRTDVERAEPEPPDVRDPGLQLAQPMDRLAVVVLLRCARKPQRIDVIEHRLVVPCHVAFLSSCPLPVYAR